MIAYLWNNMFHDDHFPKVQSRWKRSVFALSQSERQERAALVQSVPCRKHARYSTETPGLVPGSETQGQLSHLRESISTARVAHQAVVRILRQRKFGKASRRLLEAVSRALAMSPMPSCGAW